MVRRSPTEMLLVVNEFHFLISLTVMSKCLAMAVSVSPAFTWYVSALSRTAFAVLVSAGREASAVVTTRGMRSDWPLLSFDVGRRSLAAARSAFVTWKRLAIVASGSPALAL